MTRFYLGVFLAVVVVCRTLHAGAVDSLDDAQVQKDLEAARANFLSSEQLEKASQRARGYGVELKAVHRSGDVGRSVCAAAEDLKADLLVIASQDRRPVVARGLVDIDRLLGSSVSDYIRVHAPAPVLLVREPEGRN